MKKEKKTNRFKLPKQFPGIIKQLDRLVVAELPKKLRGTIVLERLVETKQGLWLLGDSGNSEDIEGVWAGRFNINIRPFLDGLAVLKPGLRKEINAFNTWFGERCRKEDAEAKFKQLSEDAMEIGYVLKKP